MFLIKLYLTSQAAGEGDPSFRFRRSYDGRRSVFTPARIFASGNILATAIFGSIFGSSSGMSTARLLPLHVAHMV